MVNKEKLHEALGELIYALAMVDGTVQEEERKRLEQVLSKYSWGEPVLWSFNYESNHQSSVKDAYSKAFSVISEYGPFAAFYEVMEVLEATAEASQGIDDDERALIDRFKDELHEHFLNNPNIK